MASGNTSIFIDYTQVEAGAETLAKKNTDLRQQLADIENYINSLSGTWESDSAAEIRSKITGMEKRFEEYFNIIDNYKKLLNNAVTSYKGAEQVNTSNAESFI